MTGIELVMPILGAIGENIVSHYMSKKECKKFINEVQKFMCFYTNKGYLEPIVSTSAQDSSPTGWKTTPDTGLAALHLIYPDIRDAIEQTAGEQRDITDLLQHQVIVNVNSSYKEAKVRERIGAGWLAELRQSILKDEDKNPFAGSGETMNPKEVGRHCTAVMTKSRSSQGLAGAVILRVLVLARACGVYELGIADLLDLIANAGNYEHVARSYIATVLGLPEISRFGHRLPDGHTLGSKQKNMATTIPGMLDANSLVQVGMVDNGKAVLTYPCPVEQLEDVQIKIKSASEPAQGEPIFMDPVLAMALSYRPANKRKRTFFKMFTTDLLRDVGYSFIPNALVSKIDVSRQNVLKDDVHGNPLWKSQDAETVQIRVNRSLDDQKLHAIIVSIGDNVWKWTARGVFGQPCGCDRADPNKRIMTRQFRGIQLYDIFCHSIGTQWDTIAPYGSLMLYWVTGDVPLVIARSSMVTNPYVQVFGECLYCAVNRAMAFGCMVMIAGGS